ncbi:MAG TPA: metalloregulator ArsR/SmtB family transcription factor [bacterium]|nr:metalloregulator ArsR/SmtB family transcription factor [bacterium]HQN74181.1 metalloregulator ArsR/SmtB family transcription factor [bacterium]HQO90782.1 metalloregulator ArsR/SmtB family transcription factor [bacterium]
MKTKEDYKREVLILKALANEARLMIVDSLKDREITVGELTELLKLDQSTVSKHLSVLYNAGILDYRKDGNLVYYQLLTPCVLDAFKCACRVVKEGKK